MKQILEPIEDHLDGIDSELNKLIKMNNKQMFGRPLDNIKHNLKVHHLLVNMRLMNKVHLKARKKGKVSF